ncbi:MAG: gluconate 2-dehydrogenase subunit 3 family protein [Pseudomonadota bacterium]
MNEIQLSRRAFLRQTGIAARNSLIVLSLPVIMSSSAAASEAMLDNSAFKVLGSDEAREFAAIAARIIPTDETPGATEAGVIYFIDNVLGTSRTEALAPMREGLASLQATAQSTYGSASFSALTPEQQDALLVSIEETEFFGTMRYMTIAGMTLERTTGLRSLRILQRFRLRGGGQVIHCRHDDSAGAGDGQLRVANWLYSCTRQHQ